MCTVDSAGAGTTGAAGPGAVTSVAMAMANIVDNKSENMFVLNSENEWCGAPKIQKLIRSFTSIMVFHNENKFNRNAGNLHCFKMYSPKKLFFPSSLYP